MPDVKMTAPPGHGQRPMLAPPGLPPAGEGLNMSGRYVRSVRGENHTANLAQKLRAQSTPAEALLWQKVRGKQLNGLKIRRQHCIHNLIVDFYCATAHLVIELDGEVHKLPEQKARDLARTNYLVSQGYQVIRFTNNEVFNELPHVLNVIKELLEHLTMTETIPLPPGRG